LRGSSSIRATCRGAIVIVPGESSYRLLAENGYADRLDVNVRVNPETLEWKLIGNWTPRIDGDMKTQILDHLNLFGEATVAEVAKSLSFNAASVSTVMSRLNRDGLVDKQGGSGRSPARYMRSSNLLKQLETQFEHPNPYPVSDTDLLKQQTFPKELTEKVIIESESDHSTLARNKCASYPSENDPMITFAQNDHFSPTQDKLFEQSHNVDGVRDVCSNSKTESLSKFGQTGTRRSTMTVGSQVRYTGSKATLSKLCGSKKLNILEIKDGQATVKHDDWVVTQTIPTTDLKPCK
jgi:DNA-binding transcriptional ArsR family regulator